MPRHIGFLRAVNVRPRLVRMERVRAALGEAGFADVETYIQTGNVAVTTPLRSRARVESALRECLSAAAGFDIPVMVRSPREVSEVVARVDGIPALVPGGGRRYVYFASEEVGPEAAERLHAWEPEGEAARVLGRDVLVELGVDLSRARLTGARLERMAGPATARDLRVVRAIAAKWGSGPH
ncbi:DUF1697 domain-containing protein [Actinomycetota bacterium]